jgi:hypothetical protein
MLGDRRLEGRQRLVLRFIGGPHVDPDNQVGVHEFHDVALVPGERPRPRFAAMPHLGIAQRWEPIGRDPAPNATLARRRIRFQVLGEHAAQRREGGLHGRRLGDRHVRRHPGFHAIHFRQ